MNFNYYCNLYRTDKGDLLPNGNGYASWYDYWFAPIRNNVTHIGEIGVHEASSLRAMHGYFPQANIIGLDIADKSGHNGGRVRTRILNQGRPDELDLFVSECKSNGISFDIFLDDGSHDIAHQQLTFGKLFQLVKAGGIYIIEDLGSSYFNLGAVLYGNKQTQEKINNNTVQFLNQRPFSSPWISDADIGYINNNVEYVSIFDKLNASLTYSTNIPCVNNYPIRSITSVIKKTERI